MKKVILGLGILLVGGATMFAGMNCSDMPSNKLKHCKPDDFMKMKNKELAKELNLTSEQLAKLDSLADKMKDEMKPPKPPRENPLAKYTVDGAFDKTAFESDMINKDKARRLLDWMVLNGLIKKKVIKYAGNANLNVYEK